LLGEEFGGHALARVPARLLPGLGGHVKLQKLGRQGKSADSA
jgi:hypothetical protein